MLKLFFLNAGIGCALLFVHAAFAQITPGSVVYVEPQKDGVVFRLQTGTMKVLVCSPSVFHVLYSPDGSFPQRANPMIAHTTWPEAAFKLESAERDFTISTGQLNVLVAKKDGRITFKDRQDNTLLREGGDDGGKLMVAATVHGEQTYHATELFYPAQGEAFYGLGQHQSGVWDYSGESVELSQANTNISIPFLCPRWDTGYFGTTPRSHASTTGSFIICFSTRMSPTR